MEKSKILLFTSPTCPHCPAAEKFVHEIAKERDDATVEIFSSVTTKGQKKARSLGVMSVPTIFVKGPNHPEHIGFRGVPHKKNFLKAIDISLGKADFEKKISLSDKITKLFSKFKIKLKL